MQNNNTFGGRFQPASQSQLDYLKRLGYTGDVEGLTSGEASSLINQLKGSQPQQNQVSNAVQPTNTAVAPNQNEYKSFSNFMDKVGNKLVANTLTDPQRQSKFIANIVSAVSSNPALQECNQTSVISAALQAEVLNFPINNSFGFVYLVPYKDKKTKTVKAQFQIGYKGYIQLAIRSGQYRRIEVTEVREGELGEYNPLKGQVFNWIPSYSERKNKKVVGYAAELELINGFTKLLYISYEEMLEHADTYSQAFDASVYQRLQNGERLEDAWKYSSFWYKNFDDMAMKTCIRQLISKWGIMSVEMQQAYLEDMKIDNQYLDNPKSKEYQFDNIIDVNEAQQHQNASVTPNIQFNQTTGEVGTNQVPNDDEDWMNQ